MCAHIKPGRKTLHADAAAGALEEAQNQREQRALARSIGTDHPDRLARSHRKRYCAQRVDRVRIPSRPWRYDKPLRDVVQFDQSVPCMVRILRRRSSMEQSSLTEERRGQPRGRHSGLKGALYSTLRWIARHVRGFYSALIAFLTVSLVLGAAAISVFVAFSRLVSEGFTQRFDERILQWFQAHRSETLNDIMLEATVLGSGVVLFTIVAIASVFLWQTKHHWSVYILLMGVFGGQILNGILKGFFNRQRPSVVEMETAVHSLSFPSGHAMTSMVVYGSVAYLVARLEPTPLLRASTYVVTGLIILAIGITRMYLGVHYPTDVFGGYVAGLAWLAIVASSVSALRFFAGRRPETLTEEHDLNAEPQRAAGVRS